MKQFVIKVPRTSASLRRTYNKSIEIYEYDSDTKTVIQHYRTKDGKWKTKTTTYDEPPTAVLTTVAEVMKYGTRSIPALAFKTFEEALMIKLYLINKLYNEYINAINRLKATMEKNCPDVSEEFNELKRQHPECFV
jgi:hypothetical protein